MINKENAAFTGKRRAADLIGDARTQVHVNFTIDQLFADLTNQGHFTSDEMSSYIEVIKRTPNGMAYFDILFDNLQFGYKILSPLLPKIDRANNTYVWLQFSNGEPTKVILLYGMLQFIKDYQNGKIRPDFDGYAVVKECYRLQNLKEC